MEINSPFTGKRGVSLPFTDFCEPILSEESSLQDVTSYLIEYAKGAGWKSFELRGGESTPKDWISSADYYKHTLYLDRDEEEIFSSFRSSTKRNIKKAIKEGVKITKCNSLESVREFYRLNCMTRKKHGIPPQPYYFFKQVFKHVLSKDQGSIILASHNNKIISGAVYFHFGEKAIYKYGASDASYQHLRANNLVMWEAIKRYRSKAYKTFCFGRTNPDNEGLLQFKSGWGTTESIMKYYKFDIDKNTFQKAGFEVGDSLQRVFNRMPIPLLKMVSFLSYKHIG